MDLELTGKTVLVLASSQGIGEGTARVFAREGANVMMFGRGEEKLAKVQKQIMDAGKGRAEYFVGDILKPEDIAGLVSHTVKQFGPPFALFNNTGGPPPGGFSAFDDAAWQSAYELTLLSYIRTVRAVVPHMVSAGGGRVINVASSSTKAAIDNLILSNVFRTSLLGLTKSLAAEFGPKGILFNILSPGKIATERLHTTDGKKAEKLGINKEALQEQHYREIPLGRYGTVDEFGRMAAFLCSPTNTYISGQNVVIDGGYSKVY